MAEKPTYKELVQRVMELEKENTELLRAEEALKGREEKFRSALMDLPIMINAVDQNSIIVFWNKECEKITGYTAAEMIGNPNAMELLYPEREYLETELKKWTAQNYKLKNAELILSAKDGSAKTVLWTNTDFSSPEWIWAVGVDITARERAEEELRHRSTIEAAIAKASSLFVSYDEIDYDTILQIMGESVSVNRAYIFQIQEGGRRMSNKFEWCAHGTAPQKDMLQDLETNMFPWWMGQLRNGKNIVIRNVDELPPVAAAEKEILQAQQIRSLISVPIWSKRKALWGFMGFDDTEKTREFSGTEIEALQIVGEIISGDLERRASENKLEFEREQLLSIFDSIDEIIYITDPNTYEILYVNQTLKDAFQKELIGKICYREFQGNDSPCAFCTNEIILKQKPVPYRWEYHNPKLDRDFTIVDRVIKWPDGRDVRFELAIDVTERKKLEERIQQAQKLEAIGTLAGGIAHDFNNILFPLVGFAEMLKMDIPLDSPSQNHIDEILRAALRSKDLVKQILTFSRQSNQNVRPIKLQPIVKEALALIRSSIPTTIEIQHDIDPGCGIVVADSTQIHQIIMNLATNAYHAMEQTGGRLKVHLKQIRLESDYSVFPEITSGEYAFLTVADTGNGIEKDVMDKIFDPYFTTKETGKGTGLGLSVVLGIVKSYNGDIRIYSEPGKGAEVHVYLPIMDQKALDIQTDRSEYIQGGTEKILLVDDEEIIVRMEQQMLERLGYRVTIRTGSVDALEAFKANPDSFDLVVTDMTMPNMTGVQFSMEIKKIRPDIPVILCTGFSYLVNDEKSKALGIQALVMKPVVMKEIAETIRKVLDNSEKS
jgi:PAS domain S-box-containing protein